MNRSARQLVGVGVLLVAPLLLAAGEEDQPPKASGDAKAPRMLGIMPQSIHGGVLVQDVIPDSAADKAGIKAGDVIVSVDGYAVGFVDGREYPIHSELRRIKDRGVFKIKPQGGGETVTKEISLTPRPEKGPPLKERKKKKEPMEDLKSRPKQIDKDIQIK
jgi:S1-C subfamily serine protease